MPYRRTPAVQARMDGRRDAVLGAARALLADEGYAGCTVAAVAARARIATGSVYRHFPSKSVLAVELFRSVVTAEVDAVSAAARRPEDPAEGVAAAVETFARRALASPRLAYALLAEPVDTAVEAERLVFRRAFRDVFAARIAEGTGSGRLPRQDPLLTAAGLVGACAEALIGPLSGAAGSAATGRTEGPGPHTPAHLVAFTLRALGVPHADHP
ncbi:TetR/AcrR family transcriptional regulator [Streptomyces sp. B22F1]|uniref:TetR/AcrR family transcriptional regulator n=1 Tax=Streptomyces sp. B22F1 TaxID=3153566 RepID=UPI00325F3FF4